MKAVISFQAGVALLEDPSTPQGVLVLSAEGTEPPRGVRAAQHLLMSTRDLSEQDVESAEALQQILEFGFACDRGLQMLLILIDGSEHSTIRPRAGKFCEDLIKIHRVRDFVANRMYQQPLPRGSDLDTALSLAGSSGWTQTLMLLNELNAAQSVLQELHEAFEKVPDEWLEQAGWATRPYARRQLADTGVLRALCQSGRAAVGTAAAGLLEQPREHSAGFLDVLTTWMGFLQPPVAVVQPRSVATLDATAEQIMPPDVTDTTTLSNVDHDLPPRPTSTHHADNQVPAFNETLSSTLSERTLPDATEIFFRFLDLSPSLHKFYTEHMTSKTVASLDQAIDIFERHTTTPFSAEDVQRVNALLMPLAEFMAGKKSLGVIDDRSKNREMLCGKTLSQLTDVSNCAVLKTLRATIKDRLARLSTP